jgi:NodT family efflux transporter outer membrane factor (OMF) lipoprotein
MSARVSLGFWAMAVIVTSAGCVVGPKYQKPTVPATPAFKEVPPPDSALAAAWKAATPQDDQLRGDWWTVFNDPQLDAYEQRVATANQNVAEAEARFRAARAAIRGVRADLFPTVTAGAAASRSRGSANKAGAGATAGHAVSDYQLPIDFSYELDLWGRVRRSVEASVATAQASAADWQTALLSSQAELAVDYFQLRGIEAEERILDETVTAYRQALQLTTNRFNEGLASGGDVALARVQLSSTLAQATDLRAAHAQFAHAIAVLIGQPPAAVTVPAATGTLMPPPVPLTLPGTLVERRPDVAAAERRVAAANAQIGVAMSAYFPNVTLAGDAGLESAALSSLFSWPSRLWSLGPQLIETVFDGGRRRSLTEQARASYDAAVAAYRQEVLMSFQDVEDSLSTLVVLADEDHDVADSVTAAQESLTIANNRYIGGIAVYLEVITAQNAALVNQRTAADLHTRRLVGTVLLIKALGGGWTTANLPQPTP